MSSELESTVAALQFGNYLARKNAHPLERHDLIDIAVVTTTAVTYDYSECCTLITNV